MATISTTADTDFAVAAQGTFRIHCTGKVRLLAKQGSTYTIVGDWPNTNAASGVGDVHNQEAGATYKWLPLTDGAAAVVTQ